jgi:hypothetical protein
MFWGRQKDPLIEEFHDEGMLLLREQRHARGEMVGLNMGGVRIDRPSENASVEQKADFGHMTWLFIQHVAGKMTWDDCHDDIMAYRERWEHTK